MSINKPFLFERFSYFQDLLFGIYRFWNLKILIIWDLQILEFKDWCKEAFLKQVLFYRIFISFKLRFERVLFDENLYLAVFMWVKHGLVKESLFGVIFGWLRPVNYHLCVCEIIFIFGIDCVVN